MSTLTQTIVLAVLTSVVVTCITWLTFGLTNPAITIPVGAGICCIVGWQVGKRSA